MQGNQFITAKPTSTGLTVAEVQDRLRQFGPNRVAEERRHPLLSFLAKFWAPVPWMLEAAIGLELVLGKYVEAAIIALLLVFNAALGLLQEGRAQATLTALKSRLALSASVRRDGKSLTDYWKNGIKTLHGFYSHGFPNCFHMGITQNALTANFTHMLDEQSAHIAEVIQHAKSMEARNLEPTAEAEAEWAETVRQKASQSDFHYECTPGYYNNEGHLDQGPGFVGGLYDGGPIEFHQLIRKWRSEGDFKGLKFS